MAKTNKEEWHIKKKFNLLRRMTVWCLTAAMLLTSLPLMTMTVNAAKRDIASSYNYYLTVKTANETNAKTNDDIYCIIKTATGERSVLLDKKNHNDFRKGATDTYTLSLNLQPWEIHAVGFEHRSGSDAVKIEYFKFELPDGTTYSKTINTWFNKYKKTYSIMGTTDRQVTGRGNFDETFDKNVYYELDQKNPSDITLNWNGKVTDQYFNEYKMIDYAGAIDITFSAYGRAYAAGGSKLDMTVLENNGIATLNTTEGYQSAKYVTGITLNGQKLFEHMEKNRIYKLTLTATLDYEYDYDQYKEHSETYTIYRKGFGLGEASAVSQAYTPLTDYNFYTSESKYSTIKIKIPVIAYDNYNANTIASSLASNISKGNVTARVYYDKTTTNSYVTPQSAYSDKDNVYLVCKTPAGYKNTENIGITVCLYDAKATYSGKEYKLDTSDGNYSCLISTHKVDTQGADVAVLNTDGTQIGTSLNTYQKTHSFKLSIDQKERVFVVNKDNTRSEGYISYELLTQDGKTVKSLKNYKTTPTTKAPYSTNAIYTVEPTETLEGEFKLRITTRDIANNLTTVTYPIKLDNIAPRVQYTLKSANQIDGSMRNEYVFKIEDASQTGKLYYCVVPKGESMPEPGKDIPEHTGAVVSQYGRWSFISQTSAATSAVVSVEKGKYFEGTLYWYTVDAAGNDSRTENKGKYYSTSICIDNIDNDCKIVVDDSTPGKESYDISFVTNKNNRVKYQWRGANIVTALTEYKDGMNPGESWQKLDSGKSVQLTGTYTLVCKVITPDGTESTYTQEFLFDNTAPQVSLKDSGGAATAQRSFTIEAKDLTNIEAFTYSLYKADGTPVDVDVALSCGLPIVSTSLMFEPEEAGTYYIEVTATDINGQTTTAKSDVFAIRNTAPQIETVDIYYLNEFGNVSTIQTEYNGIPLIGGVDYLPTWRVTEEIDGIGNYKHLNISYNIYYRFSADGINYGTWKSRAAQINTEPDVHQLYAYLDYEMNPIALNEGENRIWIQAAFAPAGTDPKTIRHEYLSVNDDFLLIRDTTAPTCSITYDSVEMTADAVYATLTYSDAYTSADDIDIYASKVVGMSFVLSDDGYVIDYSTSPDESINRLMFTENNNDDEEDDNYLELVDRVGNTTILPINITCIDKEPPIVMVTSSSAVEAGQRRDQMIDFWVDKADDTRTEFALVRPLRDLTDDDFIEINPSTTPDPDRPGEEYKVVDLNSDNIVWGTLPEDAPDNMHGTILDYNGLKIYPSVTDIQYPNGESRTNYKAYIYADEYNGGEDEIEEEPYILAVRTYDNLGNYTVQSVGYYMMLKNATARVLSAQSISEYAYQIAGVKLNMSVPVYVMPEDKVPQEIKAMNLADGRLDHLVAPDSASEDETARIETIVSFAEDVIDAATHYTTEPTVLVKQAETVSGARAIYFADEAGRVYKQTLTIADPKTSPRPETADPCTVYLAFVDTAPVTVNMYRVASNVYPTTFEGLTPLKATELPVVYNSQFTYYVVLTVNNGTAEFVSVDSSKGIVFDTDYYGNTISKYANDFVLDESLSNNKVKVFTLADTQNPDKSLSFNIKIKETVDVDGELVEKDTYLGSAYELKLLDTTPPEVYVSYNKAYTNKPLTVNIHAFDPELMTSVDEAADESGIDKVTVSIYYPLSSTQTDKTYNDNFDISLIIEERAAITITAVNKLGLVSKKTVEVENVSTKPISVDTDAIRYYGSDTGFDEYVEEGKYYSAVEAWFSSWNHQVINNGGSNSKILTPNEPSFTFIVRDKYGNTAEVPASFDMFDTTAPTLSVEPTVSGKTNEPYRVWIDVQDAQSGVAAVAAEFFAVYGKEKVDVICEDGQYYMTVSESGNYTVTASDNSGNTAQTSFTVSNIDTSVPMLATPKYTVEQTTMTRTEVGVKLYYTEPNVTLVKVEPIVSESMDGTTSASLTANDYSVNMSDSTIRFFKSGSLSVTFVDEYGNLGSGIVTVNNIWMQAPNPEVTVAASEDALSATITLSFAQEMYPYVTEQFYYYALCNGSAVMAVKDAGSNAYNAAFTVKENGTYIVYAMDSIGNMKQCRVVVDVIDRTPPEITDVSWNYTYTDQDGNEQTVDKNIKPGTEAGYVIVEDENNKATNQDITATVTTNKPTVFAGSSAVYSNIHSIVYDKDGWVNFDMVAANGLIDSYGLGLYLIDKDAPVIEGVEDLMFFENPNANASFNVSYLRSFEAYDIRYGTKTDLTDKVKISYIYDGVLYEGEDADLSNIGNLPYDKNKPVTVIYTVKDSVGNETTVRCTVTLVGLFDTTIRVNGNYTDANGMIEVDGGRVSLTLDNFAGLAWARYESGIYSMAQMKNKGTVIKADSNGAFTLENLSEGWYTFYVQTDLRDYFCVKIYIFEDQSK